MNNDALALLELSSLARGVVVGDVILKRAHVLLHSAEAVSNGKFILLFSGDVSSVDESLRAGINSSGEYLVDKVFLPQVHPQVVDFLKTNKKPSTIESLGIIETNSVASIILVADTVCKTSPVKLVELKLAKGIGGKGFLVFSGDLPDVEASVEAGSEQAEKLGTLAKKEIIPSPHQEFSDLLTNGGNIALR
ncbi:MAG: hypothetical protein A3F16_00160 [Deltaproteobacteria bacterium RIFCSPHIGHO2_12_FULL_43_9]|nr:MAG: hypothetical protein A3F16_00160 [Deltaproteobacteria bacterium RIFCSPHIGHO2_12_FULL_43_9]